MCRQVNKELLTAMEQSTEQIGKVFLELAPYLKFYSTYANDFEKATKLVEEWTEKHKVGCFYSFFYIHRLPIYLPAFCMEELRCINAGVRLVYF